MNFFCPSQVVFHSVVIADYSFDTKLKFSRDLHYSSTVYWNLWLEISKASGESIARMLRESERATHSFQTLTLEMETSVRAKPK